MGAKKKMDELYLAADVGGTNARICMVDSSSEIVEEEKVYATKDYSSFLAIVKDFLVDKSPEKIKISKACFAVAGPVISGQCRITNLPWDELDEEELSSQLGFPVTLINDFVAQAYNILLDPNKQLHTLQEGSYDSRSPIAIIGAGTGLGKAFAIPTDDCKYKVFPTEGGHVNYGSRNELT